MKHKDSAIRAAVFAALLWGVCPAAYAQDITTLECKEGTWVGSTKPLLAHSSDACTGGIPLADSEGIKCGDGAGSACALNQVSNSNIQLALQQVSDNTRVASQFRVLAKWPSGNVKWVLVDAQVSPAANTADYSLKLVKVTSAGNHGNYGGSDLASEDATYVNLDTGAATFRIKKANNNLYDKVTIGGTDVVLNHGATDGLVWLGPTEAAVNNRASNVAAAVSCTAITDCVTPWMLNLDGSSTAVIEENGPLRTVVKVDGNGKASAGGPIYLHATMRLAFWKGKTSSSATVALRNADCAANYSDTCDVTSNSFTSAAKSFRQLELRLTQMGSGTRNFSIANDTGAVSGSLTGTDNAYLYQGFHNSGEEIGDWPNNICSNAQAQTDGCVWHYIKHSSGGGDSTYLQNGYQIKKNGTVLSYTTSYTHPPVGGWADVDASGLGVTFGLKYLSFYWPASLELWNGGSEIRVGLWPDQALYGSPGSEQAYTLSWGSYDLHMAFFGFHTSAAPSPADDFLKFQHPLMLRAAPSGNGLLAYQYYNAAVDASSGMPALGFQLPDPAAEDTYLQTLAGVTCCLTDIGTSGYPAPPRVYRFYLWGNAGAGNQHEFAMAALLNYLQRGLTGRAVWAGFFYKMLSEHGYPHCDFSGCWRSISSPLTNLENWGFPKFTSYNAGLGNRNWVERGSHEHTYGFPLYYFLTGDEFAKTAITQGMKDAYANTAVAFNDPAVKPIGRNAIIRGVGHSLATLGSLTTALRSWGDPDIATLMAGGDKNVAWSIAPDLNLSGYGEAQTCAREYIGSDCSSGTSRVRGILFAGGESDPQYPGTENPPGYGTLIRAEKPFMYSILLSGLDWWRQAAADVRGPLWTGTVTANGVSRQVGDVTLRSLEYGIAHAMLYEDSVNTGDVTTSGMPYFLMLDYLNSTPPCSHAGDCSHVVTAGGGGLGADEWYLWAAINAITGSLTDMAGNNWQPMLELMGRKTNFYQQGIDGNLGAYHAQAAINAALTQNDSGRAKLKTVLSSQSYVANGSGQITVSWTPPSDLGTRDGMGYWLKYSSKQIVGSLKFHSTETMSNQPACTKNGTGPNGPNGCWEYSPDTYANFWAASDPTAEPAAGDSSKVVSGLTPGATYYVTLKYYGTGVETPPAVNPTVLKGTLKGGVIR